MCGTSPRRNESWHQLKGGDGIITGDILHDCNMVPEVIITGGQIVTRVAIVAKQRVASADGKRN